MNVTLLCDALKSLAISYKLYNARFCFAAHFSTLSSRTRGQFAKVWMPDFGVLTPSSDIALTALGNRSLSESEFRLVDEF